MLFNEKDNITFKTLVLNTDEFLIQKEKYIKLLEGWANNVLDQEKI